MTYSATGLPPALSLDPSLGTIAGTVTTAGTFTVTATVSDGTLSGSQTFTWTVTNVNRAPTLTAPPNQTSAENATVSLQLVAAIPTADALTYSATGLPRADRQRGDRADCRHALVHERGTFSVTATAVGRQPRSARPSPGTVTNVNRAPTLTAPPSRTMRPGIRPCRCS